MFAMMQLLGIMCNDMRIACKGRIKMRIACKDKNKIETACNGR